MNNNSRNLWISAKSAFICVLFFTSIATAQDSDFEIDRKETKEPLAASEKLIVINPVGDIRVRRGGPEIFEAFAVIQNLRKGTPAPEIKMERAKNEVIYKVEASKESEAKPDRADIVIYIPDASAISCETDAGLIEIKGIGGAVSAKSVKGEIIIRGADGRIQATNDRGSIMAVVGPKTISEAEEFSSRTGDITLYLEEGIDATVSAETSGEITTDFSIQIDHDASKEPDKKAKATIGKGTQKIAATSKRGRIKLLRLLKTLPEAQTE